ncbi:TetR family transcriptional regulator [Microlunatus phosphovorus NM-1]|uniref:TetR family transcriptional regulator n=1 Tax=Microlunatus phosphovorus (strain ATCC 700054 / DSM 10555 / JCM 9379 / NBRC 101784 / NCIMB 13414 / VKM Ac-1990 / NM-1) TaxID=1032480 RepID=F5XLY2_MICPN|nr:TetR family transcriptional regulator [Microlunatus phosphovorus]BAK33861.1 TetR family transcriptional regulator [Microlunatus phosphovorus NM-1]
MAEHERARGQADPGRRDRIIDVTLDVIAANGVAGTSHRKVAAAAGVPLGSMTYHFSGMDELLREAFGRFADRGVERFSTRMAQAQTPADALEIVAGTIVDDTPASGSDEQVVTYELYTLAARDASFRDITERWMDRTRGVLEKHFDPLTARLLDALLEGLAVHRTLDRDPVTTAQMIEGIRRITKEATTW